LLLGVLIKPFLQGLALSMGEKITTAQKNSVKEFAKAPAEE
jgi:hypothetical protein